MFFYTLFVKLLNDFIEALSIFDKHFTKLFPIFFHLFNEPVKPDAISFIFNKTFMIKYNFIEFWAHAIRSNQCLYVINKLINNMFLFKIGMNKLLMHMSWCILNKWIINIWFWEIKILKMIFSWFLHHLVFFQLFVFYHKSNFVALVQSSQAVFYILYKLQFAIKINRFEIPE